MNPAAHQSGACLLNERSQRKMAQLRKYIEWMNRGRRTERIAYVIKEWDLPKPLPGAEWQLDSKFNMAAELLDNPHLKSVFKEALEKGGALYSPRTSTK